MVANSSRFSGTRLMPARTRASMPLAPSAAPSKRTVPREGSTPMMAFSSVVLPAPFGPMTVTMLPASTRQGQAGDGRDAAVADGEVGDLQDRAHATLPR